MENVTARDVGFLLFLTLLNILNYVDRQLLASFANWIVPELELTNTQFGLLTGLVFIFFYAVMGLFMGALADRLNRTRLIAGGLALWSALTALSGLARGFVSLAIPRMFIGVGESILTPASLSLIGDRFPAKWQGAAMGVFGLGVPIGVGLSLFVVAYLEPIFGWRGCFYLLGAIGVVLAGVMLFMKEPRRITQDLDAELTKPSVKEIVQTLVSALKHSLALKMTIFGGVAFTFMLGAGVFEQLWFAQERGFERTEIARITAWYAILGGVAGTLFGGYGGDLFLRKTGIGRPMFLFWTILLLSPINIAYRIVEPGTLLFWSGLFFTYFQVGCFYGPVFATVQELTPPRIRGTMMAFVILSIQLFGVAIGVSSAGVVIDWLISANIEEPYTVALLVFTLISLASVPMFWLAGHRFERDRNALLEREGSLTEGS